MSDTSWKNIPQKIRKVYNIKNNFKNIEPLVSVYDNTESLFPILEETKQTIVEGLEPVENKASPAIIKTGSNIVKSIDLQIEDIKKFADTQYRKAKTENRKSLQDIYNKIPTSWSGLVDSIEDINVNKFSATITKIINGVFNLASLPENLVMWFSIVIVQLCENERMNPILNINDTYPHTFININNGVNPQDDLYLNPKAKISTDPDYAKKQKIAYDSQLIYKFLMNFLLIIISWIITYNLYYSMFINPPMRIEFLKKDTSEIIRYNLMNMFFSAPCNFYHFVTGCLSGIFTIVGISNYKVLSFVVLFMLVLFLCLKYFYFVLSLLVQFKLTLTATPLMTIVIVYAYILNAFFRPNDTTNWSNPSSGITGMILCFLRFFLIFNMGFLCCYLIKLTLIFYGFYYLFLRCCDFLFIRSIWIFIADKIKLFGLPSDAIQISFIYDQIIKMDEKTKCDKETLLYKFNKFISNYIFPNLIYFVIIIFLISNIVSFLKETVFSFNTKNLLVILCSMILFCVIIIGILSKMNNKTVIQSNNVNYKDFADGILKQTDQQFKAKEEQTIDKIIEGMKIVPDKNNFDAKILESKNLVSQKLNELKPPEPKKDLFDISEMFEKKPYSESESESKIKNPVQNILPGISDVLPSKDQIEPIITLLEDKYNELKKQEGFEDIIKEISDIHDINSVRTVITNNKEKVNEIINKVFKDEYEIFTGYTQIYNTFPYLFVEFLPQSQILATIGTIILDADKTKASTWRAIQNVPIVISNLEKLNKKMNSIRP
jgi:hypothetical protein